jgi:hypothetical protein
VKFGIRTPSLNKRIAARTSWKRYVRHNLGFKAPRGWGWLTNPKRAAYNRVYSRTTVSLDGLFKRGRRRGSRHDGAALGVVLALVGLAALGAYSLIVGAVLFVAWLVRVATKRHPSAPTQAQDTAPRAPDGERDHHAQLIEVDSSAFAHHESLRAAAGAVFDTWLAHVPSAPRNGADLIREVGVRWQSVGRLTSSVRARRFAWRGTPFSGRQPTGGPPLDPATLDPWNPPHDLKTASHYFATCWTCHGDGRVACSGCGGSARQPCRSCDGSGKYLGTAANGARRLLNCKECRGKGTITCAACTRGRVDCGTCQRSKKLECWLEIDESTRTDVQLEPAGELVEAFEWDDAHGADAADHIALDGRVAARIEKPHPLTFEELPASVPSGWRQESWPRIQAKLEPGERVEAQALVVLDVPSTTVSYVVMGETDAVTFEGLRMLAPPPEQSHAFTRRALVLRRVRWILAALPIAAGAVFVSRGSYYVEGRGGALVAGMVAATSLVAICAYAVLWYATIGRRAAVRWACGAVAPAVALAALAVVVQPSIARARAMVDAGQLDDARVELSALGPPSSGELAPLWNEIHLREAQAASTCTEVHDVIGRFIGPSRQRDQASARADSLAIAATRDALHRGDLDGAGTALACASPEATNAPDARSLRATIAVERAKHCVVGKDWACALARAKDASDLGPKDGAAVTTSAYAAIQGELDGELAAARAESDVSHRVELEKTALALWTTYLAAQVPKEPQPIALLKTSKTRDEAMLARQAEAARQRAAAEERQRVQAEQREKAREEAAERAQAYRPLLCSDGSLSPACTCGGSWRGCCSHHGGVAGCQ